ncbi:hypothetical protein CsSME_00043432 [Camellia sinensis var. sinensis]
MLITIVVALLALPVATATSSLSGNRRIFSSRRFDWFLMTFGSILANQNQDILLVLAVQAQECLSLSGVLVLVEPVSTVNGGDQHLAPPKTERCSNCSGSGKVNHALGF